MPRPRLIVCAGPELFKSFHFSDDLPRLAPHLRIIAHCGGEVKSRFARSLFDELTITAAPTPMARATAELRQLGYDRFVSFEWEKKWHLEIADAAIALPHFVRWVREG